MNDQVTRDERVNPGVTKDDFIGVANKGIAGIVGTGNGWILAFVILFAVFQISNHLTSYNIGVTREKHTERLVEYLKQLEDSSAMVEINRASEIRRMQDIIISTCGLNIRGKGDK